MNARDVMSSPVITIGPETRVPDIAALLIQRDIRGVPVVAQEKIVGIVSEGDLLHRVEVGTDRPALRRPWWRRMLGEGEDSAHEYVKTHARRVKHIMTRNVITVAETTPLAQIASILEEHRIRRVPVMRGKQLVGIVTRVDLVQALQQCASSVSSERASSDDAIRNRLLAELQRQPWWHSEWTAVGVTDGVVYYRGLVESEDERRAARVAAENVPGVRSVVDRRLNFPTWQPMV